MATKSHPTKLQYEVFKLTTTVFIFFDKAGCEVPGLQVLPNPI
jgi:hypothetical protein